jgi:nucleoside-diphosphate-sugar epimerase
MNNPKSIRLLIAGCGDLGMRVARLTLMHPSAQVWGLRRSHSPNLDDVPERFTWLGIDLSKPINPDDLPKQITHILFSAAPDSRTPDEYQALYLKGLQNIVGAADNPALERVMFISSTAVYGEHDNEWVTEDTPVAPKNFNGQTLLEAEQWLRTFGAARNITTLSLRLSGIYGPGRNDLLVRLKKGLASAPTTSAHWANRIHVEDAAAAVTHLMVLEKPDSVYLVTDSTPLPMRILYEDLAKLVGGPIPPEGAPPVFVGSKRLSNERLRSTGFRLRWPDSREGYRALIEK